MARNLKGINNRKPEGVCMVIGCDRTSLYRSPFLKGKGVKRGYCSKHKALAMTGATPIALARLEWPNR